MPPATNISNFLQLMSDVVNMGKLFFMSGGNITFSITQCFFTKSSLCDWSSIILIDCLALSKLVFPKSFKFRFIDELWFYKDFVNISTLSVKKPSIHNDIPRTFEIERITIFMFSLCIGLVTQLNDSALGVLKHHYITKRIRELLIGNSRFLIYNLLNQLLY